MKKFLVSLFVFLAGTLLAQEIKLEKVESKRWTGFLQLQSSDTLPSPTAYDGFYEDSYALPPWHKSNEPIWITLYGEIPEGSNLTVEAVWDVADYGFGNFYDLQQYSPARLYWDTAWSSTDYRHRYHLYMSSPIVWYYKYISVMRESTAEMKNGVLQRVKQNGLPCVIDSVTTGLPKNVQNFVQKQRGFYYGKFLMQDGQRGNHFGK